MGAGAWLINFALLSYTYAASTLTPISTGAYPVISVSRTGTTLGTGTNSCSVVFPVNYISLTGPLSVPVPILAPVFTR
jgi:hypothetical protein